MIALIGAYPNRGTANLRKNAYAELRRTALANSLPVAYDLSRMVMNQSALFLTRNQGWNDAIQWANQRLTAAGMRTVLTFDFQIARSTQVDCTCPHHGTESCNCQIIVLLVYDGNRTPVSLLIHSNDDQTWFYLADSPLQRGDPELEMAVRRILDQKPIKMGNLMETPSNSELLEAEQPASASSQPGRVVRRIVVD